MIGEIHSFPLIGTGIQSVILSKRSESKDLRTVVTLNDSESAKILRLRSG